MNNDEIFRNEHPHEVVMPEGSHIAVSKTNDSLSKGDEVNNSGWRFMNMAGLS
jgi:hypothetical protein